MIFASVCYHEPLLVLCGKAAKIQLVPCGVVDLISSSVYLSLIYTSQLHVSYANSQQLARGVCCRGIYFHPSLKRLLIS